MHANIRRVNNRPFRGMNYETIVSRNRMVNMNRLNLQTSNPHLITRPESMEHALDRCSLPINNRPLLEINNLRLETPRPRLLQSLQNQKTRLTTINRNLLVKEGNVARVIQMSVREQDRVEPGLLRPPSNRPEQVVPV